jgi:hypothetical protein
MMNMPLFELPNTDKALIDAVIVQAELASGEPR